MIKIIADILLYYFVCQFLQHENHDICSFVFHRDEVEIKGETLVLNMISVKTSCHEGVAPMGCYFKLEILQPTPYLPKALYIF